MKKQREKYIIDEIANGYIDIDSLKIKTNVNISILSMEINKTLQNMLFSLNKLYLEDIIKTESSLFTEKEIEELVNLAKKYIEEGLINLYFEYDQDEEGEVEMVEESLDKKNQVVDEYLNKKLIKSYFVENDVEIKSMPLSVRSMNSLLLAGLRMLSDIVTMDYYDLKKIRKLGEKSIQEVLKVVNYFIRDNKEEILAYSNGEEIEKNSSIEDMLLIDKYREKIKNYFCVNDLTFDELDISVRSKNALLTKGYSSFKDIVLLDEHSLRRISNLGSKSITEIISIISETINKYSIKLLAYCNGDKDQLYSDEKIISIINDWYKSRGFEGISYRRLMELFPSEIEEERIKKIVGMLIEKKELEYVDYRCYRKYMSFYDYLKKYKSGNERNDLILKLRYSGSTLEEIANALYLTRERIRQISDKLYTPLKNKYIQETGCFYFDEDYYEYLYSNYYVDSDSWNKYFHISDESLAYLKLTYNRGGKDIEKALSDEKINIGLRRKIQNIINRNKILLDGNLVNKKRSDIEYYIIKTYCKDEITSEDFFNLYDKVLKKNGIEYDERIYINKDLMRSRINKISDSNYCLWKEGKRFRYYDIENTDFTELLQEINLPFFSNIHISTQKLINDHKDIMKKYDIRDKYELHNLLKKIVNYSECNEIDFNRQPIICFGSFDREKAINDVVENNSPISLNEILDLMYEEYGFDKTFTQFNLTKSISQYYHNGIYSVDFSRIPEDRIENFKTYLKDDLYKIEEIKKIYKDVYPDANTDDINPRSLKVLGFKTYAKYVLQNYSGLETYFREMLLKEDVFDISELRKKCGLSSLFDEMLFNLKKSYEIIEFDNNQFVNFRRLRRLGIEKEDIEHYCDSVYEFVANESYFTIDKLRKDGFSSKMDDLGFGNLFYWSLLNNDDRFVGQHVFGSTILYKGNNETITRSTFIKSIVDEQESIGIDELRSYIKDCYGLNVSRENVVSASGSSELYYDQIMDKIYKDKNDYYSEFDE